jgi:phosphate starvation-inducible PhoH-like protein
MEKSIHLRNHEEARAIYGERDRYLKMIRNHYDVRIFARDGVVRVSGEEEGVLEAYSTLLNLIDKFRATGKVATRDVENALLGRGEEGDVEEAAESTRLDPFEPKTEGQRKYVEAIRSNTITFGIGPAGTGKTFLAVGTAVSALVRGHVNRLVLVRPAVEAGEKLGFLPGDLQAKVDPYLRPIFDALGAIMPKTQVQQYMERDVIEVAPLAYMRGRTLERAFVILDEAQNATPKQMLMLLTRLGPNSICVVTGDLSQTDLPAETPSGLEDAVKRLAGVPGIAIIRLGTEDVVRHKLVQKIIDAYGADGAHTHRESSRRGSSRSPRGGHRTGHPSDRAEFGSAHTYSQGAGDGFGDPVEEDDEESLPEVTNHRWDSSARMPKVADISKAKRE